MIAVRMARVIIKIIIITIIRIMTTNKTHANVNTFQSTVPIERKL